MDTSNPKDSAARIAEIQGRLAAQRVRLFMDQSDVERSGSSSEAGASNAGGAGHSLAGNTGFPRSATMRLLLEHPEWVEAVLCWLARRFSSSPTGAERLIQALLRGFFTALKDARNAPSRSAGVSLGAADQATSTSTVQPERRHEQR